MICELWLEHPEFFFAQLDLLSLALLARTCKALCGPIKRIIASASRKEKSDPKWALMRTDILDKIHALPWLIRVSRDRFKVSRFKGGKTNNVYTFDEGRYGWVWICIDDEYVHAVCALQNGTGYAAKQFKGPAVRMGHLGLHNWLVRFAA